MDRSPHYPSPRGSDTLGQPDGDATPPGADEADSLLPDRPLSLLDGSGEFTCPHCDGTIRLQSIGLRLEGANDAETIRLDLRHPDESLDEVVDDVRRVLAIRALREAGGVKVKAAEIAGMKYTTFYELVRRLGITDDDLRD